MLFNLHTDYVRAAAPRSSASVRDVIEARRAKDPPGSVRAHVAHALASAAHRVDRESARRALAS
jgi:hypothetical protein